MIKRTLVAVSFAAASGIWEAGSGAGTCKIVARGGTGATPVTIADNIGAGC